MKIFVGMSGGVDSSVSAALLKEQGHEVIGAFIKAWQPDWTECGWKEERLDAMRAAAHLGMPFETVDLGSEYKKGVIDYMLAEYADGRTPNPDVMCNREIKFGAFWEWAKGRGADAIATGHYARNECGRLLAGKDKEKDQSYFLWTLGQSDLEHAIFPIGEMEKKAVRKLAKELGLPNAEKKDSQGLCFIGKVDVKDFLRRYIEAKPGDVLDEKGEVIGRHEGAALLTIGERRGFTITKKTPADEPRYVIAKDMLANTVTVSARRVAGSPDDGRVRICRTNWITGAPAEGSRLSARSRYRAPLVPGSLGSLNGQEAVFRFDGMAEPAAPGQSLVLYDGDECVGGGIIV